MRTQRSVYTTSSYLNIYVEVVMGINKSIPAGNQLTIQTMMAGFHEEFYLKDDYNLHSVKF